MPTVIKIDEDQALDGSSYFVTLDFADEDGDAVSPKTLFWSLLDSDENVVNGRDAVAPGSLSASMTIVLSGDDINIAAGRRCNTQLRYFTVSGTYDSDLGSDLPITDYLEFLVRRIPKKST